MLYGGYRAKEEEMGASMPKSYGAGFEVHTEVVALGLIWGIPCSSSSLPEVWLVPIMDVFQGNFLVIMVMISSFIMINSLCFDK